MSPAPLLNIKPLLEEGRESELAGLLSSLHPADVAEALSPLDMEDTIKVMSFLDIQQAADVLVELSDSSRDQVALGLPRDQLTKLVAEMDSDDAADIVGDLDGAAAEEVLSAIGGEDSEDVRRLLMYDGETAGGLMQIELISAADSDAVAEVVEKIREVGEDYDELGQIFVVGPDRSFLGAVSLKSLLLASPRQSIGELVRKPTALVVRVDEDQESVAQKFQKYDVRSAPVVDSQNRLLGRITVDDIMDVVNQEADKDFYRLAGSSEEEIYASGALRTAALRLPWLLFNLGGGFITSFILTRFEASLVKTMALVTFVPLVMSLSGAVGSQSATITVRGLATGRIAAGQLARNLLKEQKVTTFMALTFGLAIALLSGSLHQALRLGLAVGLSVASAVLVSAFLGAIIPVFFKTVRVDPALASGPVVTSVNDVVSLLIYIVIGTSLA
ncbi:MAG: magnesium transporter [Deltaproteobacteria bacterium]|jgi:magnesium transporter|nr:magnesium transporter [Deltaproteobacteria bacterium]